MDQKKIGAFIAQCRKEKSLTQIQLAELLDITNQAVSKWESGASAPSTTNLIALAKLFNMTPEDLLKEAQ